MSFSEFRDGDYVKASVAIPGRAPVEMKGYLAQIGSELVLGHAVVRTVDGEQGPEILSIELAPRELSWEEFDGLPTGARFKDKDGGEWVVEETGCRKTDAYFMTIVNPDWVFSTYRPITATARVS